MHVKDTIRFDFLQGAPLKAAVSALAGVRVAYERIRESRAARVACWIILAALVLTLEWLVAARVEQGKAQRSFEAWQERFVDDYISMQEAKEIGYPPDPREELRKQEAMEFAKVIRGLKNYRYSYTQFLTLAWCMQARINSAGYDDTLLEVIRQPGQWPGFQETNEVTQADYDTALRAITAIEEAEHPACSSDYVYASFEREGITLRDTWDISTKTHFWRYEG